jgi:hypothetical protein
MHAAFDTAAEASAFAQANATALGCSYLLNATAVSVEANRVVDGVVTTVSADVAQATAWRRVRAQRQALLTQTDWLTIRASEGGPAMPEPWRVYRQALQDVTLQADPTNIVWPTPPTS